MVRKGYNWKARTVVKTVIDDTKTKKIQIQLDQTSTYDQCNALVLPSAKRETKIKHDKQQITRILTKKQRKNLEKIVEQKKKKENRASLLEALSKVQATPEERDQLTSIASVQTKGLKKYFQELRTERKPKRKHEEIEEVVLNSLSGSKRKRMSLLGSKVTQKNTDPNIVGLESESETSEEESDVEEAQKELSIELKNIPDEIDIGEDEEVDENELNLSNESENILAGELQIVETIKENPIIIVTDDTSEKEVEAHVVPKIELKKNPEEVDIGEDIKVDEKVKYKLDNESEKIKLKQELKSKSNKKQQISKTMKENPIILITDDTSEKELEELKKNPEEIDIGEDEVVDENKLNLNNEPEKIKPNEEIKSKSTLTLTSSAIFISVDRPKEIQKSRLKLPILAEEQHIMETINENPIILVAGETGSGKTTQVPQFLYEAGYAQTKMIAITEPRRVAAIAMSKRVGEEMNLPRQVSYLIRFEGNANDETKIKFMTDGVLLKELQSDFLLTKYSVIILDEAHERSVYTDILIGLLSRIVPLRIKKGDPLKLIIMSATLRLDDFISNKRLFKIAPPVIKVDARQYSVTVHFNKRTPEDYIKEAFQKVIKIHTKLPEGAILIFVTGQNEINRLVHKLRQAFPLKHKSKLFETLDESKKSTEISDSDSEIEENLSKTLKKSKKPILPQINLDDYSLPGNDSEVEEHEDLSDSEEHEQMLSNSQPLWTLPLYSLLPGYKQAKVFQPPPDGCRLCIVSTNVAETSLTIPNVKYVVDTGKSKSKLYDKVTGVTSYQVMWTSKASANQRAGRAGRTGPGHCYRLYSSAVFNDTFQEFAVPEIQQKPVDDLYLQMKCMNIDKVINFPFPSAPDLLQLKTAEHRLEILGAMKLGKVTPLGKAIAQFPVLPRFGKMLALSHQQNLLPYTICMVAALTVQEVLLETPIGVTSSDDIKALRHKWSLLRRKWAGHGHSSLLGDPMVLLRAVGAAEYANSDGKLEQFCRENGLRHKAVVEIRKLRMQLTNDIKINVPGCDICVDPKLKPPNDVQAKLLRQILLAGMGDQVAKKMDPEEFKEDEDKIKYKYAYRAMDMEDPVFLHSSSVLRKSQPTYVIYQEIYETNKLYMRGLTVIEPEWLPIYVPHLCNMGEPVTEPRYEPRDGRMYCSVSGTFGRQAWPLPMVEIEYPKSINMYKWFGRFLLEGKIFTKLEKYAVNLLSMPSTMVKSWAKLQPRTDAFLKALMSRDVNSKSKLEDIWRLQPQFLLHEYQKWLPESGHNEVSLLWPPVDSVL